MKKERIECNEPGFETSYNWVEMDRQRSKEEFKLKIKKIREWFWNDIAGLPRWFWLILLFLLFLLIINQSISVYNYIHGINQAKSSGWTMRPSIFNNMSKG